MKKYYFHIFFLMAFHFTNAQKALNDIFPNKYVNTLEGSQGSIFKRIELSSDIDTTWFRWKERGYHFGFNPSQTPMYSNVNGILSTPYMVQVRGNSDEKNKKRWGYHVFEGYAKDDKSRITMLVNKHIEESKPVAELYYEPYITTMKRLTTGLK